MVCYIAAVLMSEHVLILNVSDFWKGPEIDIFFCLKLILINTLDVEKGKKEIHI